MASSGCPWGKLPQTQAASFNDVMSEELARKFEREEILSASMLPMGSPPRTNGALPANTTTTTTDDSATALSKSTRTKTTPPEGSPPQPQPSIDDDLMLAKMLQEEFDKEAQLVLSRHADFDLSGVNERQRKLKNGDSIGESASESEDDSDDVDRFATAARTELAIGVRGFARNQDGVMKTKHDADVCGRRHACKVMELTSGIATGDGSGFDMKLNNSVYNSLRVHSKMEERRAARLHDKKEKATAEQTMDMNTRLLVYKLVNRQILEEVNGCISTGKEATVFHAKGGVTEEFNVPDECAVKVFKTTLNEFKNRSEYIKDDYRFKDHKLSKLNPRKTIHVWAEKELNNLQKIHRAGINCPQAVILKKHVLVMTFIGADGKPAPKLRDAHLNREQLREAWHQCSDLVKRLYKECKLVHADLSEYNLLWHLGHIWVIDVSQSVDHLHPHALEFLLRDCTNLCDFFRRHDDNGSLDLPEPKQLFQDVCGLQLPGEGAELLAHIRHFVREADLLKRENEDFYDQRDQFEVMFAHAGAPLLNVAEGTCSKSSCSSSD